MIRCIPFTHLCSRKMKRKRIGARPPSLHKILPPPRIFSLSLNWIFRVLWWRCNITCTSVNMAGHHNNGLCRAHGHPGAHHSPRPHGTRPVCVCRHWFRKNSSLYAPCAGASVVPPEASASGVWAEILPFAWSICNDIRTSFTPYVGYMPRTSVHPLCRLECSFWVPRVNLRCKCVVLQSSWHSSQTSNSGLL